MESKRIGIFLLLTATVVVSGFASSYASHGSSGGGGGCSGDCSPPTLGLDQQGKIRVEKGLTINSESFDVEFYSQTIPTQLLKVGEKNTISLKIFENTVPEFLSHAELHFDIYEKMIQGVLVEQSTVSIVWDDTGGDATYAVYGKDEMFKNVSISHKIDENLALLTFEFEPTQMLEESTLMIVIWDEKRNASKNYFDNAIKIVDETNYQINEIELPIKDEESVTDDTNSIVKPTSETKIPSWIKNTAGWWSEDKIDNSDFILGMQYLLDNQILTIPDTEKTKTKPVSNEIPIWIKNTAGWWHEGLVQDQDFIKGMQYLINTNIVQI